MDDNEKNEVTARTLSPAGETFKTGNLEFVAEQGENGGKTTYQEASGAPVEVHSPLGTNVKWYTIIFLNLGQMIGTGVFSTRTCG
jgi:GTPase involved in cell partitioning and DNA repair